MKKFILAVVATAAMLLPITAFSEVQNVTASVEFTGEADFLRVYERTQSGKEIVADNIEKTLVDISWQQDLANDCHTWFFVSVLNSVESSGVSNSISWCQETNLPEYIMRPLNVIVHGPVTVTAVP